MKTCPQCGGEIEEWDEPVYLWNGDVDQAIFRKCKKCGAEY